MRAFAVIAFLISAVSAQFAEAQIRNFPYDAKVVVDEVFVRSGAGDSYYPTQKLPRETVVKVHRHDPGGWYMIDPPKGSFSWIPERYVKRLNDTEGEVAEESVIAFVGSEFGDEASVFQRRLKTGEKITILGQRQIITGNGPQSMLQVAPPARERRWIPGSALVPIDPDQRAKMNADPYAVPPNAERPDGVQVYPSIAGIVPSTEGVSDVPVVAPSEALAAAQQKYSERQQLADIDRRFGEMLRQDSSTWNLDAIETEYHMLQQSVTQKSLSGTIDMRYPAIERYRRRLVQLTELRELTSQTERRDASLVGRNPNASTSTIASAFSAANGPESVMIPGQTPQLADAFEQYVQSNPQDRSEIVALREDSDAALDSTLDLGTPPQRNGSDEQTVLIPNSPQNPYVGAGIVQRASGAQGSGYILASPSGKVLAELKPKGNVSLDAWVGQQVGVQGTRFSEEEKNDVIEVSALARVQLR
ncbi:MAG TPA: SH3 domain-containing protein [Planctomycetaceae bacterium]|mgnify:CR=1 FL=1|nr:SH3 domain-containing protein [Planctomycetaceae bacterium]